MKIKRYLENLIEHCSENDFAAEAIEVAIVMGWVKPGYDNMQLDIMRIMTAYDDIIDSYREWRRQNPEVRIAA
jgi:hypothetical protein